MLGNFTTHQGMKYYKKGRRITKLFEIDRIKSCDMDENEKQNAKEKFKGVDNKEIAPILKETGFSGNGVNFHCHTKKVLYFPSTQKSQRGCVCCNSFIGQRPLTGIAIIPKADRDIKIYRV